VNAIGLQFRMAGLLTRHPMECRGIRGGVRRPAALDEVLRAVEMNRHRPVHPVHEDLDPIADAVSLVDLHGHVGHAHGHRHGIRGHLGPVPPLRQSPRLTLPEVAVLYGMVTTGFALAEAFGRGFDVFASYVKSGDFDRFLLRPRRIALQVGGQGSALAPGPAGAAWE